MGMLRPARSLPAAPPSRVRVQAGGAHAIGRRSGRRVVRSLQGVTQALGARVRDGRLSTATGREAQGCICQHALQRRRRSTGQRRASGAGCCRICERDSGRAGRRRPAGARLAARRGRPDCARTLSRCARGARARGGATGTQPRTPPCQASDAPPDLRLSTTTIPCTLAAPAGPAAAPAPRRAPGPAAAARPGPPRAPAPAAAAPPPRPPARRPARARERLARLHASEIDQGLRGSAQPKLARTLAVVAMLHKAARHARTSAPRRSLNTHAARQRGQARRCCFTGKGRVWPATLARCTMR